jgi:hypothetical protein
MFKQVALTSLVLSAAVLTACTGTLPSGTTIDPKQPGFNVRLTKNGAGVSGRTISLKSYNGATAGSYGSNFTVVNADIKTDSTGSAFVPVSSTAAAAGGLFGISYNAATGKEMNAAVKTAENKDEIQWFNSKVYDLSKTNTAQISVDLAWDASKFTPADGSTVSDKEVKFMLPLYTGATEYEVIVNKGTVIGSGAKAFSDKSASNTITWSSDVVDGDYSYTAKVFTEAGQAGVQASSPVSVFTVKKTAN